MIEVGESFPLVDFGYASQDGHMTGNSSMFGDTRAVLFGVPGAFTPTCSHQHLPEFVAEAPKIRDKGIDLIGCVSVNDVFVMEAWGKSHNALGTIIMIADGNGTLTKACGLSLDASGFGMGMRCKRYAMVLNKGVVDFLGVEENPAHVTVSGAHAVLNHL